MHLNAVSAYFILSPSELHLRGIFCQKYMVDSVSLRMVKLLFEFNNHENFFFMKGPCTSVNNRGWNEKCLQSETLTHFLTFWHCRS